MKINLQYKIDEVVIDNLGDANRPAREGRHVEGRRDSGQVEPEAVSLVEVGDVHVRVPHTRGLRYPLVEQVVLPATRSQRVLVELDLLAARNLHVLGQLRKLHHVLAREWSGCARE